MGADGRAGLMCRRPSARRGTSRFAAWGVAADAVEGSPVVHPGLEGADQVGERAGVAVVGQGHDRLLIRLAEDSVAGRPGVGAVGSAQGGCVVGEGVEEEFGVLRGDLEATAPPLAESALEDAGRGPVVREQVEQAGQHGAGQGAGKVLDHGDGVVPNGDIGAAQLRDEESRALRGPVAQGCVEGTQDAADRGVLLPGVVGIEVFGGQVSGTHDGGDVAAADVQRRYAPAASVAQFLGGSGPWQCRAGGRSRGTPGRRWPAPGR